MMKRAMSKYSLTGGCLFWRVPYVQMNLKENKHMNKKKNKPGVYPFFFSIFAHESFKETVRLKTILPSTVSWSTQK